MITTTNKLRQYCAKKNWGYKVIPKSRLTIQIDRKIGYLIESHKVDSGEKNFHIQSMPGRANMSNKIKLSGWLGNTNGLYSAAHGIVAVMGENRSYYMIAIIKS